MTAAIAGVQPGAEAVVDPGCGARLGAGGIFHAVNGVLEGAEQRLMGSAALQGIVAVEGSGLPER